MTKLAVAIAAGVLALCLGTTGVLAAGEGRGKNFVDENNDGICDNRGTGKCHGRGQGRGKGCK